MKIDFENGEARSSAQPKNCMPRRRPANIMARPREAAPDDTHHNREARDWANTTHGLPRRRPAKRAALPNPQPPDDTLRAAKARGRGHDHGDTHEVTASANQTDAANAHATSKHPAQHRGDQATSDAKPKADAPDRPLSDAARLRSIPNTQARRQRSPATPLAEPKALPLDCSSSGAAIQGSKPITTTRRRSSPATPAQQPDVGVPDCPPSDAAIESPAAPNGAPTLPARRQSSPATGSARPMSSSPDCLSSSDAANMYAKPKRTPRRQSSPATLDSQPMGRAPDCPPSGPAGRDAAIAATKPNHPAPRHDKFSDGHSWSDNHEAAAVAGDDRAHGPRDTHGADSPVIAEIIQLTRLWSRWLKGKNKLVLQGKALCRQWTEGDKGEANKLYEGARDGHAADPQLAYALVPFLAATGFFEVEIEKVEKTLEKLGRSLPVWSSWAKDVKGLSALGLAKIVGSANADIGTYRNPSCLWKRMGLAVMGDHRQGNPGSGATADEWTVEAYSSARRSLMWNIGNSLIGGMGKFRPLFEEDVAANEAYSEYQKLFAERCRVEAERLPHKDGTAIKEAETGKESYTLHAANRAKRYVEKRLLRDLWQQWRRARSCASEGAIFVLPAAKTNRRSANGLSPIGTISGVPTGERRRAISGAPEMAKAVAPAADTSRREATHPPSKRANKTALPGGPNELEG